MSPCYHHGKHGLIAINATQGNGPRLERHSVYKETGAITLTHIENIKNNVMHGEKVGHITMLPEESVKLSSDYELWLVKNILERR